MVEATPVEQRMNQVRAELGKFNLKEIGNPHIQAINDALAYVEAKAGLEELKASGLTEIEDIGATVTRIGTLEALIAEKTGRLGPEYAQAFNSTTIIITGLTNTLAVDDTLTKPKYDYIHRSRACFQIRDTLTALGATVGKNTKIF